jgi:hypothetical protein
VLDGCLVYTFMLFYYTQRDGKHQIIYFVLSWFICICMHRLNTALSSHFPLTHRKLFTCSYLRNTDASTFLFTRATWRIWYGLVACIECALHSYCLISLLHDDRVLLNYYVVHVPSTALCRSDTSWKIIKYYVPKHTFTENSKRWVH